MPDADVLATESRAGATEKAARSIDVALAGALGVFSIVLLPFVVLVACVDMREDAGPPSGHVSGPPIGYDAGAYPDEIPRAPR